MYYRTTLTAPAGQQVSVTFTDFRVRGNFDWLAIFDGSAAVTANNGRGSATNPTSSDPLLWNSSIDGDELADMFSVNSITFTSTNGSLTFASRFSGVVNICGWEANVIVCNNGECPQPELFITTWDVDANDVITIPLQSGTYDFDYKWTLLSNPTVEITGTHTNADGDFTTNFVDAGTYQLEITRQFPHFRGYPVAKLLDVTQWGQIVWESMFESFKDWDGVSFSALDIPNLSQVTSMNSTFRSASNFDSDIGNWNVSNIEDMFRLFQGATNFNQNISSWVVSKVTGMNAMFENAERFNQNISGWNVSKATGMNNTFKNADDFNQPIGIWNVSSVTSMINTFDSADSFNQDISDWDVSKVTNMRSMFENADNFNQPIEVWDVSKVTEFREMFTGNDAFNQSLGNWKFNPNASFSSTFNGATAFDCQTWSSTILGWNFSNPDLENIPVGGPNVDYDLIAARARDELVARGWSINGTAFDGDCGAVHEFACSESLGLSQDTLFGTLLITGELLTFDSIFIDTSGVVECKASENIVMKPGFHVVAGSDFIAQIGLVECASVPSDTVNFLISSTDNYNNDEIPFMKETRQAALDRPSNLIHTVIESPHTPQKELSFKVFPNPFEYETQLHFYLPEAQKVSIYLIDQMGSLVQTIIPNQRRAKGEYRVNLRNEQGLRGMYYVVLQTKHGRIVQKVIATY